MLKIDKFLFYDIFIGVCIILAVRGIIMGIEPWAVTSYLLLAIIMLVQSQVANLKKELKPC